MDDLRRVSMMAPGRRSKPTGDSESLYPGGRHASCLISTHQRGTKGKKKEQAVQRGALAAWRQQRKPQAAQPAFSW